MKKFVSSVFILILLLVTCWGISVWVISQQNKDIFNLQFEQDTTKSNDIFQYTWGELSTSMIANTTDVTISVNDQNYLANVVNQIFTKNRYHVDVKNGPILFDHSGLSLGRSSWKLSKKTTNTPEVDSNSMKIQIPTAYFIIDFQNKIHYTVSLKLGDSDFLMNGIFDSSISKNSGVIIAKALSIKTKSFQVSHEKFEVKYQLIAKHLDSDKEIKQLDLDANEININFKHRLMNESIKLLFDYRATSNLSNDALNSRHLISYTNAKSVSYPIEKGDMTLKVDNLDVQRLSYLLEQISQIQNKSHQSQWILEEQGELPEGQDQIWQLQDQIDQSINQLIKITEDTLNDARKAKPVFSFLLNSQYRDGQSKIAGDVQSIKNLKDIDDISSLTVFSLAKLKAQVNLDKHLYSFFSRQLPLRTDQFELEYKHNKLLMQ